MWGENVSVAQDLCCMSLQCVCFCVALNGRKKSRETLTFLEFMLDEYGV